MVVELSRGRIDTKAKHDGQSVRKFEVCNFSLVPLFCYIFYFAQISLCLTDYLTYTAVSTKVVPQKRKSVRDNADWYYG